MKTETPPPPPPQINYERVQKAVASLSGTSPELRLIRPRVDHKGLTPVDACRRGTFKPKGDDHVFSGILTGGIICHD